VISHDYFPTKQMLFVQVYFACLACLPLSVAVSCPAKPGGASIHLSVVSLGISNGTSCQQEGEWAA
jgi:hypothetical protein